MTLPPLLMAVGSVAALAVVALVGLFAYAAIDKEGTLPDRIRMMKHIATEGREGNGDVGSLQAVDKASATTLPGSSKAGPNEAAKGPPRA